MGELSPSTACTQRWLSQRRLRFVAMAVLAVNVLLLASALWTWNGRTCVTGTHLGADYAAFYSAGRLLNQYPAGRLYDTELQAGVYRQLFPGDSDSFLPFANAPFVAPVFALVARLPYTASYLLWSALSTALYLGALWLLVCRCSDARHRLTGLLLGLSFQPFVVETLHGGQLSALALGLVALAMELDHRGWRCRAGMVLAGCWYKPTLLPLLVVMLVVRGRWRTLAGLAAASALLGGLSLWVVGFDGCAGYGRLLMRYAQSSAGAADAFRAWKFIDINSFLKLILGPLSTWALTALLLMGLAMAAWCWRRLSDQRQAWAAAAACVPVLSPYCGIYDAVLALPAAYVLAAQASKYRWLLVGVYVTPWFSQALARGAGFQVFTVVLAALAVVISWRPIHAAYCICRNSEGNTQEKSGGCPK